jgi:tetratricopeptide (TPR) repeat protein
LINSLIRKSEVSFEIVPENRHVHKQIAHALSIHAHMQICVFCHHRLQVAPNYPIVRANLAVALTDLGTAVKLKGQLAQVWRNTWHTHTQCISMQIMLSKHIILTPSSVYIICQHVLARMHTPNLQGIAMYERALALSPRHADALYNLGVACSEAGQTERALFCYELTTQLNPGCAEAWNNLGVLHKEADNLERAAECYLAALNARPNFPQVGVI